MKVFKDVTEGVIDYHGNYVLIEVTNDTASDVDFTINDFREQGHIGDTIPVKAGTTRQIPMAVYNFVASNTVTVVAYGL